MARLFGTDGVRGKAGEYPLDVADGPAARRGARAGAAPRRGRERASAGHSLPGRPRHARVGRLDRARAGLRASASQGGTLTSAGIMPTPAVAYLTPRMGYTAGVVISASHNPFEDNGIKVFSGAGEKFTEALEQQVEAIVADASWTVADGEAAAGRTGRLPLGVRRPPARDPAAPLRAPRHADRGRLRQRRDDDGGAAAVRGARLRRASHRLSSPTAATSTCSAVRRRRSCSRGAGRRRRLSTSASPSTATATARSSWTRPARSSTATP